MTVRFAIQARLAVLGALLAGAPAAAQDAAPSFVPLGAPVASPMAPAAAPAPAPKERVFGRSGALRVAVLKAMDALDLPFVESVAGPGGTRYRWTPIFGTRTQLLGDPLVTGDVRAPATPGVWRLDADRPAASSALLAVITEVPFSAKKAGRLNGYRIGSYATEGAGRSDRYAPPSGFIEVTPENRDLPISQHFRLGQFLTKDQANVWPKYVALRLQLIDKLELVLQELNRMGIRAERMHVMSGYRTPQYNGPGGDGRAKLSRHTYGDAADVWVDNDGDGQMDDLNGDGRVNIRDAEVMLRAVDRVEQKHPDLVGGAGVYRANEAHGPFIHIDVRGSRARW